MSLFQIGRVCLKIAGRDAGRKCIVVEEQGNFVVIDGDVRRKKVNKKHLEPMEQVVELKSGASHEDVKKAFTKLGLPVWETKSKKTAERPKKQKKKHEAPVPEKVKKSAKKEAKEEKKEAEAKTAETQEKTQDKTTEKQPVADKTDAEAEKSTSQIESDNQ